LNLFAYSKKRDKLLLIYTIKASRGSRGIAPPFNCGARWTRSFYYRGRTWVPAEEGAGWGPEPVWAFWRGDKFIATAGLRTQTVHPDFEFHTSKFFIFCYYF
jgi:hypothetical protein